MKSRVLCSFRFVIALFIALTMVQPSIFISAYEAHEPDTMNVSRNSDQIMDTMTPSGTTVNVFDYWLGTNQYDDDRTSTSTNNQGINYNHTLKFTQHTNGDCANTWVNDTNLPCPIPSDGSSLNMSNLTNPNNNNASVIRQGIVADELVNGYPVLNTKDGSATESLDYLFDPSLQVDYRAAYTGVDNLFYVTEANDAQYYEFDSAKHYAYLNRDDSTDPYFVVYQNAHIQPGGMGDIGQFLPLVKQDKLDSILNGVYDYPNQLSANSMDLNHYFGMTMTTRFLHTNDGKVTEDGADVLYEFSGDDDVWIFIDGKLVADLGGIRDKAGVRINFAKGTIDYLAYTNDSVDGETIKTVYFSDIFDASGLTTTSDSNNTGATFKNDTFHTLNFYYLERGHVDSNCRLTFNFITVPESQIYKIDELGNGLEGARFDLYYTTKQELDNGTATYDETNRICSGLTDANGLITLVDDHGDPLILTNLYDEYRNRDHRFVLVESSSTSTDMIGKRQHISAVLYFKPLSSTESSINQYPVLLSDSTWSNGTYASPMATITLQNQGMVAIGNSHGLFAVVLGLTKFQDGYEFYSVNEDDPNYMESIGSLLTEYSTNPKYRNDNLTIGEFMISTDGSLRTTLVDMPGDITRYARINVLASKNALFKIAYYYLDKNNQWKTVDESNISAYFSGVFTTRLDVPNATNRLFVEKQDSFDGALLNGATFSLYRQSDINSFINGNTIDIASLTGVTAVMTATTANQTQWPDGIDEGVAVFENIPEGKYYLVETSAPSGYNVNNKAIPIIVDDHGVHADALESNDGITVSNGVGFVVSSVERFASADDIDSTLHDIKAIPYEYNGSTIDKNIRSSELHLTYDDEKSTTTNLDYGATIQGDSRVITNDIGMVGLRIYQCRDHDGNSEWALDKQDIRGIDISGLYSGTTIVHVEDDLTPITVDIPFTKTVKSEYTQSETFTFSFTLSGDGLTNGLTKEMSFLYPGSETSDTAAPDGSTNEENSGQTTEFTDELPMDTIAETVHDNERSKISVTQESPEASTPIPTEIPVTSETPEVKETPTVSSDPTIDPTEQATDMVETPASSDSVIETTDIPLTTEDTTTGITPNTLSSIRPIGFKQHLVDAVLNQNDGTDGSTTVQQNDTFSLTINQPGAYTYTLRENSVSGDSWQYDSTIYKISITVERKGNGLVETNRVITNMTTNEVVRSIEFINELHFGSINNTLTVTKLFNDGLLNPTGFTIMIEPLDNSGATNTIEVTSTDGVTTVLNGRYASAGSYQYRIYESVDVDDSTIAYDDSYYIVTDNVDTVMVNGSATLQLNRSIAHYNADGSSIGNVDQIVFNKSTSSPLYITLSKVMENYDIASNPFSFELLVKTNEGYEVVSGPITNESDGSIHFHIADYFKDDGSYDFMVREINDGRDHVIYANPIYIHMDVNLDDHHHLVSEMTMSKDGIHYSDDPTMGVFINTYHEPITDQTEDPKPSNNGSTTSSCDPLDHNCDGVITCEESIGIGWIWDESSQQCILNGSTIDGYQLVNTKDD